MTRIISGERRYGVWGGCPQGTPEDPERCIEEFRSRITGMPHQCTRKRGPDGLYCKQHAKQHEANP